jgi:hypothetical protein
MKNPITDQYLFNLPIKAEIGDVVIYNSYDENGEVALQESEIIDENEFMYFTGVNRYGIKIGFHKSRLVKIMKSKSGQCQLFNQL